MRAGEDVAAIIDLIEQAALCGAHLPRELLDAVAQFVDDPALAADDVAALRADLAVLAPLAYSA